MQEHRAAVVAFGFALGLTADPDQTVCQVDILCLELQQLGVVGVQRQPLAPSPAKPPPIRESPEGSRGPSRSNKKRGSSPFSGGITEEGREGGRVHREVQTVGRELNLEDIPEGMEGTDHTDYMGQGRWSGNHHRGLARYRHHPSSWVFHISTERFPCMVE